MSPFVAAIYKSVQLVQASFERVNLTTVYIALDYTHVYVLGVYTLYLSNDKVTPTLYQKKKIKK